MVEIVNEKGFIALGRAISCRPISLHDQLTLDMSIKQTMLYKCFHLALEVVDHELSLDNVDHCANAVVSTHTTVRNHGYTHDELICVRR